MCFKKSNVFKALLVIGGVVFFTSCEKEFNTLGVDLVEDTNFDVKKQVLEVHARNRNLSAVRTDLMPLYQLSDYTDPVFGRSQSSVIAQLTLGKSSPSFGTLSQDAENGAEADEDPATIAENERVTKVYLDIPFFSTAVDTLDDDNEPVPYDIDSLYGDIESQVHFTVQEYTKFLRERDPATNFQLFQEYYSNEDPAAFLSTVLFDSDYQFNFDELIFFDNEDDPDTEDVDESQNVSSRFSPRIRLELDTQFFQEKIIDMEGSEVLENQNLFQDYLRGIYISMDHPSDDLKMLLNFREGNLTIKYDYDTYNEDSEQVEVAKDSFALNLQGRLINLYSEDAYPLPVADAIAQENEASRLYLKGESGVTAEVDLTAGQDISTFLADAKANDWLINEANLIFYVDKQATGNQELPSRLYLYDFENNAALLDYFRDPIGQVQNLPQSSYLYYGGILNDEEGGTPNYKFRVTEHIKSIINNDSTNVKLGLSVTGNIFNVNSVTAFEQGGEETEVPQAANYFPTSVVLYGANVPSEEQDKRVKLELIYTEPRN